MAWAAVRATGRGRSPFGSGSGRTPQVALSEEQTTAVVRNNSFCGRKNTHGGSPAKAMTGHVDLFEVHVIANACEPGQLVLRKASEGARLRTGVRLDDLTEVVICVVYFPYPHLELQRPEPHQRGVALACPAARVRQVTDSGDNPSLLQFRVLCVEQNIVGLG